MARETFWEDHGFAYQVDDVPCAGISQPFFRSQAFPTDVIEWLAGEIAEAKAFRAMQDKVFAWFSSYGHRVEPLKNGCRIDGLVAELQLQESSSLLPRLTRPSFPRQDLFVVANRIATECFVVRTDAPFRKTGFFWWFDPSDAQKRKIPNVPK